MLELGSADFKNQVFTVLCSGKETEVTWMYVSKAVESANKGTEAAEEPTRSLTVFMPLGKFIRAIAQRVFFVNRFFKDFN